MRTNQSSNPLPRQNGVVILEALIAIFIFSIGILGLVGTLSASVKNASEAQYRTEAAFFSDALIAELRVADPTSRATNYASPSGTSYVAWKNKVTTGYGSLPGSSLTANLPTVAFSGTGNRTVLVTIKWQDPSGAIARQFIVQTALE